MIAGKDLWWYDYYIYGYTEEDFEDNVVADVEWEEVVEPKVLPENIERNFDRRHK